MNTKKTLTTLIAVATLAIGGVAMAQPSSTAGAGCTATANAMKGGNLGGSPSDIGCTTAGSARTTAAAPVATTTTTKVEAPAATSMATSATAPAPMTTAAEPTRVARAPVRVARAPRADRN